MKINIVGVEPITSEQLKEVIDLLQAKIDSINNKRKDKGYGDELLSIKNATLYVRFQKHNKEIDGYENVMIIESETDKYTGTVHDYEVNYNINYGRRGRHINKNKQWLN